MSNPGMSYNNLVFPFSSNSHGFVCKKYKPGHEPTEAPPTETPTGHCPDNGSKKLSEFQGHCYAFAEVDTEGVTWNQASQKCEELGNGYKLASIHNERESAFIYSMLSELGTSAQRTELWIAANDIRWYNDGLREEGNWRNYDDTPFDYTHWADGEPNGSDEVMLK